MSEVLTFKIEQASIDRFAVRSILGGAAIDTEVINLAEACDELFDEYHVLSQQYVAAHGNKDSFGEANWQRLGQLDRLLYPDSY